MKSILNTLLIVIVAVMTAAAQPARVTVDAAGLQQQTVQSVGIGFSFQQSFGEIQTGFIYHSSQLVEEAAGLKLGIQKEVYNISGLPIITGLEARGLFGQAEPDESLKLQSSIQFNYGARLSVANTSLDIMTGFQRFFRDGPAVGWVPLTVRLHL